MIVGIEGDISAGKTLVMTRFLLEGHGKGRRILANYGLSFPHDTLTLEALQEQVKTQVTLRDCDVGIDEIHIWLDSRLAASKKNRVVSYFLLQTGKLDVTLYYTTQDFGQVDLRLRQRTDIAVKVTRQGHYHTLNILNFRSGKRIRTVLDGRPYWSLYDTKEVIRLPES